MAARLAAARQGPQRMSPAFRHRLVKQLEVAIPPESWMTRRAALVAGLGVEGCWGDPSMAAATRPPRPRARSCNPQTAAGSTSARSSTSRRARPAW